MTRLAKAGRSAALALSVAGLLLSGETLAAEPLVLAPSSPWNVDWANDSCVIRRYFGTGDQLVGLHIEQFAPQEGFQIIFSGKLFNRVEQRDKPTVAYEPDGQHHTAGTFLVGERPDGTRSVILPGSGLGEKIEGGRRPLDVLRALERNVTRITLSEAIGRPVTLTTGPLDKVFDAMRKCTSQLIEVWGLDPGREPSLSRRPEPIGDPATWLTWKDYPRSALRLGQQSVINFRLMVDQEGRPSKCAVQRGYSDDRFAQLACDLLMQRAQFDPARDSTGVAVPWYYTSRAIFFIGG